MGELFLQLVPKRLFRFLTEFMLYIFSAGLTHWRATLFLLGTAGILLWLLGLEEVNPFFIGILFIVPFASATYFQLREDFAESGPQEDVPVFGELECIFITDKDHYEANLITDKLAARHRNRIERLHHDISIYGTGHIGYDFISYPKFYYYLTTPQLLANRINKKLSENYVAILQVSVNYENRKVDVSIKVNADRYSNVKPFQELEELLSKVKLKDERYVEDFVCHVSAFYQSLVAHGLLDSYLNEEQYEKAHQLLDENQKAVKKAFTGMEASAEPASQKELQQMERFWTCEFERYRGIVFALSEKFIPALDCMFKAIRLNPYYPYGTYAEWKENTVKSYALELGAVLSEVAYEAEDAAYKGPDQELLWELVNPMPPELVPYASLLTGFVEQANSEDFNKSLESKLREDFCETPMHYYIRGEVLKYLPKGAERQNKLYVERFDEVIEQLTLFLQVDPDFPLVQSKLGTMQLLREIARQENGFDQSMSNLKTGFEFFSKFGF